MLQFVKKFNFFTFTKMFFLVKTYILFLNVKCVIQDYQKKLVCYLEILEGVNFSKNKFLLFENAIVRYKV